MQPYLTYDEDKKAFEYIRGHFATHGKLPHPDTLLDAVSVFLPPTQETYEFEVAGLKNRFIEDAMRAASDKASALLQDNKAEEALSLFLGDLLPITQGFSAAQVKDLRTTTVLDYYKLQLANEAPPPVKLGYPTVDKQGGMEPGDMIAVVGRPGSGKTWLMLYLALKRWELDGEPVLFVTQEMSATQIEKRALAMVARVNPTPLYQGSPIQYQVNDLTSEGYVAELEAARAALSNWQAPFLIYDSKMAGTVSDIEAIAALHGVKRVWIDGAYMLAHPDPRLGRYARVPENLDLLKKWQQRSGVMTMSSWQFKRGSGKDDAGGTPDLDEIGYSHAIGEYMTLVLGLLENPKNVSQMNKKHVTIMKGRNGEQGGFDIWFNFAKMDFDEISVSETETDLTYL